MKSITLTILLLLAFAIGKAQVNPQAQIAKNLTAAVIVDSIEVNPNAINTIDPNNIESISVIKGNAKYPNGVLYVTLKEHRALAPKAKSVSLQQITEDQVANEDKSKTRIYLLDGKLITDTTNVHVDANSYHNVRVMPAADAPYFKTAMPNTLLIIISTFDPKGKVWIRGTSLE